GKFVEIAGQLRIGGTIPELLAKMLAREPSSATAVRHDVRDGLAMDGQRDSFAGLDRVDHLAGPVAQITNPDLHVRQCSTGFRRSARKWSPTAVEARRRVTRIPGNQAEPPSPLSDSNRRPLPYRGRARESRAFTDAREWARNTCIGLQ